MPKVKGPMFTERVSIWNLAALHLQASNLHYSSQAVYSPVRPRFSTPSLTLNLPSRDLSTLSTGPIFSSKFSLTISFVCHPLLSPQCSYCLEHVFCTRWYCLMFFLSNDLQFFWCYWLIREQMIPYNGSPYYFSTLQWCESDTHAVETFEF